VQYRAPGKAEYDHTWSINNTLWMASRATGTFSVLHLIPLCGLTGSERELLLGKHQTFIRQPFEFRDILHTR